ncbi:MAG: holin family protein [Pseudomonadota bacterium]
MGVIGRMLGNLGNVDRLSGAISEVAEVFTPNETRAMELQAELRAAAMTALAAEFIHDRSGFFDRLVNAINRLPRPFLAFGTLGLFIFAMIDPVGFSARMSGLDAVPEPLWWLLGAIVSFYFGARELHYFRRRTPRIARGRAASAPAEPNAAISAWQNGDG